MHCIAWHWCAMRKFLSHVLTLAHSKQPTEWKNTIDEKLWLNRCAHAFRMYFARGTLWDACFCLLSRSGCFMPLCCVYLRATTASTMTTTAIATKLYVSNCPNVIVPHDHNRVYCALKFVCMPFRVPLFEMLLVDCDHGIFVLATKKHPQNAVTAFRCELNIIDNSCTRWYCFDWNCVKMVFSKMHSFIQPCIVSSLVYWTFSFLHPICMVLSNILPTL